jgi:hypothetical protein
LRHVDLLAEFIAERLPRGSLLVVTGDHGMVELRPPQRVDLADHPELAAGVRLLAGEARARHVHAVDGAAADLLSAWRAVLGDAMWVASRDRGQQCLHRGRLRVGRALGVGVEQRAARREHVVGVDRHPGGGGIGLQRRPCEVDLGGQVVAEQRSVQSRERQVVRLGVVDRDRGVLGVGAQVREQQRPPAADTPLGPDVGCELGRDHLDQVGAERAAGSGLLGQPCEVVGVGREQLVWAADEPRRVPGERVPALLQPGTRRGEPRVRVQQLPLEHLTAQLHLNHPSALAAVALAAGG